MNRLSINNGRIIDPANKLDKVADLYIANGVIVSIDQSPDGFTADITIDAHDQWVIPGIVDLCARLREPGLEHKADIASETIAATSAGITTLCTPPDTDPVIDEPAVVELIHRKVATTGHAKVLGTRRINRRSKG